MLLQTALGLDEARKIFAKGNKGAIFLDKQLYLCDTELNLSAGERQRWSLGIAQDLQLPPEAVSVDFLARVFVKKEEAERLEQQYPDLQPDRAFYGKGLHLGNGHIRRTQSYHVYE